MANLQSESSNHGLRYMLSQYWQDNGNPRTAGLPLIREGPWFTFCVIGVYLLFVTKVGPAMMRKRAAYQLRLPMLVYNSSMVVINFYFLFKSLSWLNYGRELVNFKWPEWETSDKFNTEDAREQVWSFYLYWLTKFVDLLDTIFFVLRKKDRQITHLHLYHHSIVPILGWYYIWYVFGVPAINLFAFLNSCCHTIMYSYYALSALGPQIQPYLWWKKYITQIQLLQFLLLGL
ncbi:PREDICTED: elongation of very long chain fatty acids protein 1-like, partial [Rhagoletis zephyria]|uniref:elongation of very long chain fatty acids protein 1-like n=1 Tax=Rhagoletis zephyria TaxID=28612 RepID=UPI00081123C9